MSEMRKLSKVARPYTVVVPITCESCGGGKRKPDGQLYYVSLEWLQEYRKGRRMLCPDCWEGDRTMEQLTDLVVGDGEDPIWPMS